MQADLAQSPCQRIRTGLVPNTQEARPFTLSLKSILILRSSADVGHFRKIPGVRAGSAAVGVIVALVELVPSFVAMLLSSVDLAGEVAGVLFCGLVGVCGGSVVVED